ncbi:MAG: methyltransferase domain-containing protein [Candidatus Krumholzibacteria bacterium]|nr:methyltransferase domain-containing protein [Candidatus Krumholzibacteria bacterium]
MGRVEEFFDKYAYDFNAIYGNEQSFINNMLNPILRKSMRTRFEKTVLYSQPMEGKTALDIGCGPGHYSIVLAEDGAKNVVGIDFAEEMIKIAREKASVSKVSDRCDFIVDDIYNYNSSEKFNFSILMGLMDYISDPEKMIEKVISLTSEKAFFSFPNSKGLLAFQRRIRYRKRCPLYMYDYKQLKTLFDKFLPNQYKIEKISRDYFVTLSIR